MTCPACNEKKTRVLETRCFRGIDVERAHRCDCGARWTSTERFNLRSLHTSPSTTGSTPVERRQTTDSTPAERETVSVSPTPPLIRSVSESLPWIQSSPGSDQTQTRVEQYDTPLLTFRCDGKVDVFVVWESLRAEHQAAYPALDVLAEYRKAHVWVAANPSRRKTANGMPAFLVNWLNRSQNSGRGRAPTPIARNFREEANKAAVEGFLAMRKGTP